MDALELLNQRIDIVKLMEHYNFESMDVNEPYVRSCCALHGGNNPTGFVANIENGRWYCHTGGCGGGDAFTLVQIKEELSFTQSIKWLAKFFDVDVGNVEHLRRKSEEERELKNWINAIKRRRKTEPKPFELPSDLKRVTSFRDFKPETLEHFNLLYAEQFNAEKRNGESYTLHNRIVFPIVFNGVLIGASLRRIKERDIPKWSHQPANMQTSDILYNYDATYDGDNEITVVEGMPDAWAYHEIGVTAVATFGAHLTDEQYKLLLRTGKDIVLSYDGDEAGRIATEKAIAMMRLTTNLKRVHFNEGEDPANLPREELLKRYEGRIKS